MSGTNGIHPEKETTEQLAHLRRLETEKAEALIEEYLDRVCARIRARELHPELREEIRGHIDELLAEKEDEKIPPIEAAIWALKQMGDADEVGGTLGQVHRPRFNWKLLLPLTAMIGLGLLALFSLGSTGKGNYQYFNPGSQQLFYYGMGLVALVVGLFFDYRLSIIKKVRDRLVCGYGFTDGRVFLIRLADGKRNAGLDRDWTSSFLLDADHVRSFPDRASRLIRTAFARKRKMDKSSPNRKHRLDRSSRHAVYLFRSAGVAAAYRLPGRGFNVVRALRRLPRLCIRAACSVRCMDGCFVCSQRVLASAHPIRVRSASSNVQ